jgi:hypothetical protein
LVTIPDVVFHSFVKHAGVRRELFFFVFFVLGFNSLHCDIIAVMDFEGLSNGCDGVLGAKRFNVKFYL